MKLAIVLYIIMLDTFDVDLCIINAPFFNLHLVSLIDTSYFMTTLYFYL